MAVILCVFIEIFLIITASIAKKFGLGGNGPQKVKDFTAI
jgi:hypothetical protein